MLQPVLEATQVTKSYQQGAETTVVLRSASLAVRPGEIVALEGPSGSGKTTLLSIMGCILTPTSGTVRIAGETIDPRSAEQLAQVRRRSIGFVFQQFNLFGSLSALENVEFALNVKGTVGRDARRAAQSALQDVGLAHRLDYLPRDLSGGQKQRVAIARALAGSPAAVLADEPTANVDSQVGDQILNMFRTLAKRDQRGVLIVTHDARVRSICDRVVTIHDGVLEC